MVDITCDQTAEVGRILAGSSASAFMQKELDAIDIWENSICFCLPVFGKLIESRCSSFPLAIHLDQLRHLLAVQLRPSETQLLLKCLLQIQNVTVFAKNQRDHKPIISRTHLTIGAHVAVKSAVLVARNVRGLPAKFAGFLMVSLRLVVNVRG